MKDKDVLVVKVFVNNKQIDEIHIHNSSAMNKSTAEYAYRIVKPKKYDTASIWHSRPLGYKTLLKKALMFMTHLDDSENRV